MTRLSSAISAARELAWVTYCALRETALEWWEDRLIDLGPDDDQEWLDSVLDQHAAYLNRENP